MNATEQRNRFLAFAFANADLLLEVDNEGIIAFALGATQPLFVDDASNLIGRSLLSMIAPCDAGMLHHLIDTVEVSQRFGPLRVRGAGDDGPDLIMVSGCRFPGNEKTMCLTFSFDIRNGPAVAIVERDPLTGLVEPQGFEDVALEAIQSAKKSGQEIKLSLFSFEGQEAFASRVDADAAEDFLGQTGALLRAGSFGDAAGMQGDGKYAILHTSDTHIDAITGKLQDFSKSLDPDNEGITVESGSIDIQPEMNATDAASALAFAVKEFSAGNNAPIGAKGFSKSLESLMKETGAKMSRFRTALNSGQLGFMRQPIVDLKTRELHHYEVLVRFEENKSPFQMIRFAEETGLVMELDDLILKQAIAYLSHKETDPNVKLAVNVSGRSLSSPRFISTLFRAVSQVSFPRSNLMLEITESSIIEDLDQVNRVMQKIRKLGHGVCLDDFGAGAASFQYLRALTVDFIKIDGAYIRTALKRRREAMLLKAMAGLAHDLDIGTIAESIETKDQSAMLLELGIDQGQGYLFGRPEPLPLSNNNERAA
jgi:EAL domain-containing protein (putative c-di-GMP-specific phosphodiesterase class I)